jgi:murein L,D-transpeptidase YcbB/YkuD
MEFDRAVGMFRRLHRLIFVGVLSLSAMAGPAIAQDDIVAALGKIWPASLMSRSSSGGESWLEQRVRAVYAKRGFTPLWFAPSGDMIDGIGPAPTFLAEAEREGLDPKRYKLWETDLLETDNIRPYAVKDVLMTAGAIAFARDLFGGQVPPVPAVADFCGNGSGNGGGVANPFLEDDRVPALPWTDEAIASFRPQGKAYLDLVGALERYRAFLADGGWPQLPETPLLEMGARSKAIVVLRQRLKAEGVEVSSDGPLDVFDPTLVQAVRGAQERLGLKVDGIVGPETRRALNVSALERVRMIQANLERWRWLPRNLGESYLLVNIAGFRFELVEQGRPVFQGRVVVGRPSRPTPQFNSRITRLVINPDWVVPPTIVKKDILPKARKDPTYPTCAGLEVLSGWEADAETIDPTSVDWSKIRASCVPFKFRQPPGPDNPLGQVKFMFANAFDVYLHDTNHKTLFQDAKRAFSSGCVRIEEAYRLAQYLLEREGYPRRFLDDGLKSEETIDVNLNLALPIYLTYFTAWVDEDGVVNFRNDIYGWDRALLKALDAQRAVPIALVQPR